MKSLILKYGLFSASTLMAFLLFTMFSSSANNNYDQQENVIYWGIFLAFMWAFPAIRNYRLYFLEDQSKFIRSLALTLGIFLFPAVSYGLVDVAYWEIINPEFGLNYYSEFEERIKMGVNSNQVELALKDLKGQKKLFMNPLTHFLSIFGSVFLIGAFFAIPISALGVQLWKRK